MGTNQIPPVWRLSYPAVSHNEISGQRLAGGSQSSECQAVAGKWRKMSASVLVHFAELIFGGALFKLRCSKAPAAAVKLIAKCDVFLIKEHDFTILTYSTN